MPLHLVCHECFWQKRVTLSPHTRILVCGPCREVLESEFCLHRSLDVPPCPSCGHADQLRNLSRHGTALCSPGSTLGVDCPACGSPEMEIADEAMVPWDAASGPRLAMGDTIHCRMVAPEQAVMRAERPFPVEGGTSGWGSAQVLSPNPLRV